MESGRAYGDFAADAAVRAAFGEETVPIVLNGCCGNINPWNPFDPDCWPDHRRMGHELTVLSERIIHSMTFEWSSALDWRTEIVGLEYRDIPESRRWDSRFPYEMQVFRIGDLAIVGLPGEPFVEGQLAIKTSNTAPYIFPAHLTTHYVGYLPSWEAYIRGGHEANAEVTYCAKPAPGSLEVVVDKAVSVIGELFS